MTPPKRNYRRLNPTLVAATIDLLHRRIEERFPGRGLSEVACELSTLANDAVERSRMIRKPNAPLRATAAIVTGLIIGVLITGILNLKKGFGAMLADMTVYLQVLDAGGSALLFLIAALVFIIGLERRFKRQRALAAIYELRTIVHVVDMHQLVKDPDRLHDDSPRTASSPRMDLTPFELRRYLDYCTELVTMASKLGVIYAQDLHDREVTAAVDQLETLCTGLARKIWQKIILVDQEFQTVQEEKKEVVVQEMS